MQKTISEHTTRRTLKQMGSSSRRPHRVPDNRRLENVAWSDESRFLLQHSDDRVRIWCKEHESMDPSCLVSIVQAGGGGVMVCGIFSWHTLGPLVPIEHCLNATAYLSIVADHVLPFIASSHITLQPKTGYPLKLSRVEPGQYLDGRPPGKTRLLLEEVLLRPAGGAHPAVCMGPNAPV